MSTASCNVKRSGKLVLSFPLTLSFNRNDIHLFNLSPGQPSLHEPRKTLPPPCPHPHTSEQRHAWNTSGQTCGPGEPGLGTGCGIAQHAHSSLYLGQISTGYHSGRLVINSNRKAIRTPAQKPDAVLGLDGAMAALTSLGTMSPWHSRQQARYLPR